MNSGTQRSLSASRGNNPDGAVPHCSNVDPEQSTNNAVNNDLEHTFALVQSFMVKKGLIDSSMDEEEIKEFLKDDKGQQKTIEPGNKKLNKSSQAKNVQATEKSKEGKLVNPANIVNPVNSKESPSEITIYKRAVQQINPELDSQIENLLMQTHLDCTNRKISSSSEDFLDSSDKAMNPVNFLGSNADDNFTSEAMKAQT